MTVVTIVSFLVGQVTFWVSCLTSLKNLSGDVFILFILDINGRSGGTRTHSLRFWRPALYQLSYAPIFKARFITKISLYSVIFATTPAPTVLPPSLIANLSPSSIAIGLRRFISSLILSPGITISVPLGSAIVPVTSVVLK